MKRQQDEKRSAHAFWRRWAVPGILVLFMFGLAALREPCACGPRTPVDTESRLATGLVNGDIGEGNPLHSDAGDSPVPAISRAGTAVMYLHGTFRCEECLQIERVAETTVRDFFGHALSEGTLSWRSIDYDRPENAAYVQRFKPKRPSLVLAAVSADGQFGRYRVLDETWDLVNHGRDALEEFVRMELLSFMEAR